MTGEVTRGATGADLGGTLRAKSRPARDGVAAEGRAGCEACGGGGGFELVELVVKHYWQMLRILKSVCVNMMYAQ